MERLDIETLLDALAAYVKVVANSAQCTTRAEDRSTYTKHLAAAAEIFAAVRCDKLEDAKSLLNGERSSYGRGYLSGEEGRVAEEAFYQFVSKAEPPDAA